jgi:mannosyltransferase
MQSTLQLEAERTRPMVTARSSHAVGWPWIAPALMASLAFALRLAFINHESVSGDEAFSMVTSRMPLTRMLPTLIHDYVHPPLHYFVLRGWFAITGFGLFQARLLSAIFGVLAIVFLYLLAEYLFDRRTAVLASLLLSISQLSVMYGQEARPYAQFQFLAVLGAYLFVRAMREGRAGFWWGFVATSVLMLYTDYFSMYLIVALLILPAIFRGESRLRPWWVCSSIVIMAASYLPWITSGILQAAARADKTFMGKEPYAAVHWYTLASIVNWFNNGKPAGLRTDSPLWTYIVGGLLFGAPLARLLWKVFKPGRSAPLEKQNIVLIGILCLLPVLLTLAAGTILHIPYNVRYVTFCAGFYYLLVGRAISLLPSPTLRWCVIALIVVYSANALRANYFMRWKEYWTEAFAYVDEQRQPSDCGFFPPDLAIPPQWPVTQAGRPSFKVISLEQFPPTTSECPRIWEVSWAPRDNFRWIVEHQAKYEADLAAAYDRSTEKRFFGVRLTLYSRR